MRGILDAAQSAMRRRHSRSYGRRNRMRALGLRPERCIPSQVVEGATDLAFKVYLNESVRRRNHAQGN